MSQVLKIRCLLMTLNATPLEHIPSQTVGTDCTGDDRKVLWPPQRVVWGWLPSNSLPRWSLRPPRQMNGESPPHIWRSALGVGSSHVAVYVLKDFWSVTLSCPPKPLFWKRLHARRVLQDSVLVEIQKHEFSHSLDKAIPHPPTRIHRDSVIYS